MKKNFHKPYPGLPACFVCQIGGQHARREDDGRWKTVLGVDPGFGIMGYAVVTVANGECHALEYGCIKTPSSKPFPERLALLYEAMHNYIMTFKPSRVVVEKIYFEKNTKTAIDVAQARGTILLAAVQHRIPLVECTPLQVKLAVTGFGKADKRQVQHMIRMLLKLPSLPKQDDAADALAVAYCGSLMKIV